MTIGDTPIAPEPDFFEEGLRAVAEWEADYGTITDDERAAADCTLARLLREAHAS